MDTDNIIRELQEKKRRLNLAIAHLEAVEKALSGTPHDTPARATRGRKSMSPAERQEVSERMRKYWATRRNQTRVRSTSASGG
jgi:hypothetical protein